MAGRTEQAAHGRQTPGLSGRCRAESGDLPSHLARTNGIWLPKSLPATAITDHGPFMPSPVVLNMSMSWCGLAAARQSSWHSNSKHGLQEPSTQAGRCATGFGRMAKVCVVCTTNGASRRSSNTSVTAKIGLDRNTALDHKSPPTPVGGLRDEADPVCHAKRRGSGNLPNDNRSRSRPTNRSPVACAPGLYGGHAKPEPTPGWRRRRESISRRLRSGLVWRSRQAGADAGTAATARKHLPSLALRASSRAARTPPAAAVAVQHENDPAR